MVTKTSLDLLNMVFDCQLFVVSFSHARGSISIALKASGSTSSAFKVGASW